MKTIKINLYSFSELSEQAKEKAIEAERNLGISTDYIYDDAQETVKEFCELFDIKTGSRSWLEFSTSNIDDNILNLTGLRLRTYILNNFGNALYKPKYIGSLKSNEVKTHKRIKSKKFKNGNVSNPYYSGCQKESSCILTGVCYDESMLAPVYDFLNWKRGPLHTMTFEELIGDCFRALEKDIDSEVEVMNSDEAISEILEINNYTFESDGTMNNTPSEEEAQND